MGILPTMTQRDTKSETRGLLDDTKSETRGLLEETLASPPFLLAILGEAVMPRLRAACAALDLTPRRFHLLLLLHDKGPMSQTDLHQAMRIDPSALVQLLNPLEATGLVARRREAWDRRRHVVSLTAAGERRLVEAAEALSELEEELLGALTGEQRRQLVALLLTVREGLAQEPRCNLVE